MQRRAWILAGLFLACALLPVGAAAQSAKLLAEAQKAFDRGLQAAQQQDWKLAAQSFSDAQKLGGYDPRIYLNPALANAKRGQELQAIEWFNAYLALAPNAPNAQSVAGEIARLKDVLRAKILKIVAAGREAARASGQDDYYDKAFAKKVSDLLTAAAGSATTLIEISDFDAAAAVIDKIADAKERDDALESAISSLLGRYETTTVQQAEQLFQKINDAEKRAQLEVKLRVAKSQLAFTDSELTKNFDDHRLDELLPLVSDSIARNQLIIRAARAKVREKKYASIDPLLARLESNLLHDEQLAEFLATLSLRHLEAGHSDLARAAAQRVLAIPVKPNTNLVQYAAVARAVLGDPAPVVAFARASKLWRPYQVWSGDPNLVDFYQSGFDWVSTEDFALGAATFSLTMQGKTDQALALAQSFKDLATNLVAYTNIVYALVLKDNTARALQIVRALPPDNKHTYKLSKLSLQAQAACVVALHALKKGDFATAEQALSIIPGIAAWSSISIPNMGVRYEVELLLRLPRQRTPRAIRRSIRNI